MAFVELALVLMPLLAVSSSGAADVKALKKTCDAGQWSDCVALGEKYEHGKGVAQDPLYASLAYRQACDGGQAEGCFRLGLMHERGAGHAVAHDLSEATTLFEQSCKKDYEPACKKLDEYIARAEASPSPKETLAPAVRLPKATKASGSCAGGDLGACYGEAIGLYFGEGVTKDTKRALAQLADLCKRGHEPACESAKALAR
jgi:TPR repeat protein